MAWKKKRSLEEITRGLCQHCRDCGKTVVMNGDEMDVTRTDPYTIEVMKDVFFMSIRTSSSGNKYMKASRNTYVKFKVR